MVDAEGTRPTGFGLSLEPLPLRGVQLQLQHRRHDWVHHDIPGLARTRRGHSERAMSEVEIHPVVMLSRVRQVPVLEGHGDIINTRH